ncbi:hypothetical protein ACEWY4_009760 [Coilia grayii]|uniref:Sec16 Sec23-binding domain-containing protein n=1 Tax=Coilia grayii TaxID=363190 RepID=A0ABD1K7M4_9TELE
MLFSLLTLLCRNSGVVTGEEMSGLLLYRSKHGPFAARHCSRGIHNLTELLVAGQKNDALRLAVCQRYWEHALVLNNLLNKSLCGEAMSGLISRLRNNDPIKTFCQVYIGEIPAAATTCGDVGFGDWRPHLAMILAHSKSSTFQKKVVRMMGDTLASRGHLQSAHVCYMVIQMRPGLNKQNPRLELVGGDRRLPFDLFISNSAIVHTEIYEYCLPHSSDGPKSNTQLCAALPPKMPGEWMEPPWMTSLKKLGAELGIDKEVERLMAEGVVLPRQPQQAVLPEVRPGPARTSLEKITPPAPLQGRAEGQGAEYGDEETGRLAKSTSCLSPEEIHLKEEEASSAGLEDPDMNRPIPKRKSALKVYTPVHCYKKVIFLNLGL